MTSALYAQVRSCAGLLTGLVVAGVLLLATVPAGAVSPPALKISSSPYRNGESISISVGPNRFFKPYSRINILECADRGGKAKNLPTNVSSCDGNTIQGNTILVNKNGSFSERGYELFILPNKSVLGELSDNRPVCNQKTSCVLYVGENQENFSWPKIFSHPFVIGKSGKHS